MKTEKEMVTIFPFRSFHNQKFDARTGLFLLLPIVFNLIILGTVSYITQFWGATIGYWLTKMGMEGSIVYTQYTLFHVGFSLPSINVESYLPSLTIWWGTIFISIGLYLLSYLMSDRFTPWKYFLRVFLILLWITQLYMFFFPEGFMYNIFIYTKSGFMQILALLFITPWIFLFSYYLLGYRVWNKVLVTIVTLVYFIVLAPFQYALNAAIIHFYSLLFMPPLYCYTGLMINIFAIIGFLSYGISKESIYEKYKIN